MINNVVIFGAGYVGMSLSALISQTKKVCLIDTDKEKLLKVSQGISPIKDTLIEDYSKYDKDLRLLTFKILLEKFNDNYKDLLPEQKRILKEFITSVSSGTKLRKICNEELEKISKEVKDLASKVTDDVIKIKLDEVSKAISPISNKEKISDSHLINLMQYYDLVNELRSLWKDQK